MYNLFFNIAKMTFSHLYYSPLKKGCQGTIEQIKVGIGEYYCTQWYVFCVQIN